MYILFLLLDIYISNFSYSGADLIHLSMLVRYLMVAKIYINVSYNHQERDDHFDLFAVDSFL